VKVEVHDRLEAVSPLAWNDLLDRARLRSPFLTMTWQREWVRAFAGGRRVEVRTVVDGGGQLAGALALCEVEPGHLRLVGGADVSDYLDLLAPAGQEEAVWSALLGSRPAAGGVWQLHAVPAASPTVTALPGLAASLGFAVETAVEERCPVLDLPDSWDAYLATLSGKHRHEIQRKLRRLEREAPDARVTILARPDDIETRFGDFLDLHRRSRVGKARFMDVRMESFFRRSIPALAALGQARLWFLDTAGGPIASFITVEWDGTVGLYNSGFHPDRAALSPGLVLLANLLKDAMRRGKRRFDFLRGEERYKYEFGPIPEDVCAVTIAPGP
jgi:CelD/BcsL family acetyltransferase involved in cellulose biosynthesis